jgi:16S rRNA G966 N2-methylase RsmD
MSDLSEFDEGMQMESATCNVNRDEAIQAFVELQGLHSNSLLSYQPTKSRFVYRFTLGTLVIQTENTGEKCIDYFFQHIRTLYKGHSTVNSGSSAYKVIFDLYKPNSVLDLSFGCGERLLGFEASNYGKNYYGIDPDKRVIEAGNSLHQLCHQSHKDVQLFCSPAEDFSYDTLDAQVDLIIFAPPPFNNERYTEEETQAYKRYTTLESFVKNFLEETIVKAWDSLKEGGTFLLDLGDLKAPAKDSRGRATGGRHRMVDPLLRSLLSKLPDVVYKEAIGLGLGNARFENSLSKVRVDPVWVLTKGIIAQ